MNRRSTRVSQQRFEEIEAWLGQLPPAERARFEERQDEFMRELSRDWTFPRDDPPQLTVVYRRTRCEPSESPSPEWLAELVESGQAPASGLDHEKLRALFYDTLYEVAYELPERDPTIRTALDELDRLARRIAAGDFASVKERTARYGLNEEPGSRQVAAWLEQHGVADVPLIGPDILTSIESFRGARFMDRPEAFRLRVCVHTPFPATVPWAWLPHTPGTPPGGATIPDPDSIDITIRGSWRKNARTETLADVKVAIKKDIEQLLDEHLTPVYEQAEALGVRPSRARNTLQYMRWLVLCHFPDDQGTYRTPKQYVWRERELWNATDETKLEDRDYDSADKAVRRLAANLGLQLNRKRGKPETPPDY